jgi:hypothetical protein
MEGRRSREQFPAHFPASSSGFFFVPRPVGFIPANLKSAREKLSALSCIG